MDLPLRILRGSPRVVGDKTIVPLALVASLSHPPGRAGNFGGAFFWARPLALREIGPHGDRLIPLLPLGAERRLNMEPGGILRDMIDKFRSSASVDVVFGETRETQGKAIIPVASVQYCFGVGGGEGTGPPAGEGQPPMGGSGGGGGGSVKAKPVAVLEVTPQDTRVLAVWDYSRLAATALGGIFALFFLRSLRRKR